ncbi:MAG: DNA polymerase IV [Gemmatimonadaceae bacterium]|nr:DNA polymerase IV [Gemmatimonadaceae bacterium]
MDAARRILLVDADQFFVAVARRADPEGAGRAARLIVGGKPGSRGVVCSASYEARAFGVRAGMSIAQAVRLCPDAMCVPVPRGACGERSRAIHSELERWAPRVEGASIDEWYLDLSGTERMYHDEPLALTARRIRDAVIAATGMTVSIGGGTSKLLAKLAVERGKPKPGTGGTGVHIVDAGAEADFMATVALADIPGIGPKLQETLTRVGLTRAAEVTALDHATLTRWLGARTASWLARRARGEDTGTVEARAPARQISRERTFDRDLHDPRDVAVALLSLATRVGDDLRAEGLACRTISVKLRDADFTSRSASRTYPDPVQSERALRETAAALLAELQRRRSTPARLVGVGLSNLSPAPDAEQIALFATTEPTVESPRDRDLSRALDAVRERYGASAIRSAAIDDRRWHSSTEESL